MKYDMRRPKPGQEAITGALQAIQRLGLETDSEEAAEAAGIQTGSRMCFSCGNANRTGNKFCSTCGVPLQEAPPDVSETPAAQSQPAPEAHAPGQHSYHHHYHHHYFSSADGVSGATDLRSPSAPSRDIGPVRAPLTGPAISRMEAAVRKMTQDWALACNTKQLDDLVDLYGNDALVLRPNVAPVRGTAALREFFIAVLDAGMGEVEMETLRVELFGDIAYEAGRCKMLTPVVMGKRREERGKYLLVFSRQGSDWKIVADSWSSDLSLKVTAAEPETGKPQSLTSQLPRLPRRSA